MNSTKKKDLESSLKNLTIDPSAPPNPGPKSVKKSKTPVADSWEDEASDGDNEEPSPVEAETPTAPSQTPSAPPPTPISPSSPQTTRTKSQQENQFVSSLWETSAIAKPREQGRPEKTDAVAKRMIAGALGIKAPKKTEEQLAYDKAVRESERGRREKEKEEARKREEEKERAKRDVWEG